MTMYLSVRSSVPGGPAPLALADRDVVIGRSAEADWAIPDPSMSGKHLLIGFRDGHYLARDTSRNGTAVNGAALTGIHRLMPGDELVLGGTTILFSEAPMSPEPRTATAAPAEVGPVSVEGALVEALATLVATRRRQLRELGVREPDALAASPLVLGRDAPAALNALPPAAAIAAITAAASAIEHHHAASLAAMQAALREAVGAASNGSDGSRAFVDRFADLFRAEYIRLGQVSGMLEPRV